MTKKQMFKFVQKITSFAIYTGLCLGVICPIAPAFADDSSLGIIMRRGHLRVGIDAAIGRPYMFWNAKTQFYDGFECDRRSFV